MAEDCPVTPSRQANNDLYVPESCLQQSGTDGHAEAQPCSPQLQHKKECSENMLAKENLMMKKQIQALMNLTLQARLERLKDHFHTQTIDVALKSTQGNTIIADELEGTKK